MRIFKYSLGGLYTYWWDILGWFYYIHSRNCIKLEQNKCFFVPFRNSKESLLRAKFCPLAVFWIAPFYKLTEQSKVDDQSGSCWFLLYTATLWFNVSSQTAINRCVWSKRVGSQERRNWKSTRAINEEIYGCSGHKTDWLWHCEWCLLAHATNIHLHTCGHILRVATRYMC